MVDFPQSNVNRKVRFLRVIKLHGGLFCTTVVVRLWLIIYVSMVSLIPSKIILPKQGPITHTPKALPTFTYRIGEITFFSPPSVLPLLSREGDR